MNILFVLYGGFDTNTANPIILFAQRLTAHGHNCAISVPDCEQHTINKSKKGFIACTYGEALNKSGKLFPNGTRADILHVSTPRIGVSKFVLQYQSIMPTPLITYLEDNEFYISEKYLNDVFQKTAPFTNLELTNLTPDSLSHLNEYKFFIGLSDFILIIQEKLLSECPPLIPNSVLPWGVDLNFFSPQIPLSISREDLGIPEGAKIIVYHGGLNGFNRHAMLDLCRSVELINELGVSCYLIRTGNNAINFYGELGQFASKYIKELGVVDRSMLPSILNLADVYVQPGRVDPYEDLRLPSKVPEFLAMGKPVLLPNVNIASWLDSGKNAVILNNGSPEEIANSCMRLFFDPGLMKSIGEAGREFAISNFNIDTQVKKLEDVLSSATNNFDQKRAKLIWDFAAKEGFELAYLFKLKLETKSHAFEKASRSYETCSKLNEAYQRLIDEAVKRNFQLEKRLDEKRDVYYKNVTHEKNQLFKRGYRALKNIFLSR